MRRFYRGWVEQAIKDAHACLCSDCIPDSGDDCDYCRYVDVLNGLGLDK